jgi:hypothetical protein
MLLSSPKTQTGLANAQPYLQEDLSSDGDGDDKAEASFDT